MNIIFETKFGSHLYGLATPESDTDIKGIFLPTTDELLLNSYPKSVKHTTGTSHQKNTKDDVDTEYYSLPYFIKLCKEGNTTAIDMLHATEDSTLKTSGIWEDLKSKRKMFYTSSMQSLVGYARHQAGKYGLKGTKMSSMQLVLSALDRLNLTDETVLDILDLLPTTEFCFSKSKDLKPKQQPYYEVCGKNYPLTIKASYMRDCIKKNLDTYGERARLAQRNEGVDWKALSHALRAAYQMQNIYEDHDFEYPLKQTYFIKLVKSGVVDFIEVKNVLEPLIDRVEYLAKMSKLPKHADSEYWDQWLLNVYKGVQN